MIWIAPSEKDNDDATLEKRLWDAAGQFRAVSGLKSQEYCGAILGNIILRLPNTATGAAYRIVTSIRFERADLLPGTSFGEATIPMPQQGRRLQHQVQNQHRMRDLVESKLISRDIEP